MNCPACESVALVEEKFEDVAVDRCPQCRGMWLDVLELERLLEADPRGLLKEDRAFKSASGAEDRRLDCPRCKGTYLIKLNSLIRPGTILDSCTVCHGTWLDAGEYAQLARGGLAGRLRNLFGL